VTTLLVAGLTGSGKTSATKLVAVHLGYQWLSGSDLRRKFFGLDSSDVGALRISQAISQANVDLEHARLRSDAGESSFDAELLDLAASLDNAVFDAWFLPWLVVDHAVATALLRASPATRAQRIADMMDIPARDAAAIISAKDDRARQYARKQYGVDIVHDHAVFDMVLDTDDLTTTEVASHLSALVERNPGHLRP
jgi:cytidylate kinase